MRITWKWSDFARDAVPWNLGVQRYGRWSLESRGICVRQDHPGPAGGMSGVASRQECGLGWSWEEREEGRAGGWKRVIGFALRPSQAQSRSRDTWPMRRAGCFHGGMHPNTPRQGMRVPCDEASWSWFEFDDAVAVECLMMLRRKRPRRPSTVLALPAVQHFDTRRPSGRADVGAEKHPIGWHCCHLLSKCQHEQPSPLPQRLRTCA